MTRLPPLDSLVACEAVLRHGSMTAAAAELGITQSAVSHRLRRLEAFIGTPLLRRLRAGVQATPAGTALMEGFAEVLEGMAGLRARSRTAMAPSRLRIGLGAALAQHWLVRRLPAFAARHPGIDIQLAVFHTQAQALQHAGDLDLRIQWVRPEEARSTSTQRLLFREQVFPVCAPALLPGGRTLRDPAQLAALPLLHKGPDPDRRSRGRDVQGREWEWRTWFRQLGIPGPPKPVLRFEEIGTTLAAALEGTGVALGRSLLVHDALADGRLVRLLGADRQMPSGKVHMALWPAALSGDLRLQAFVAWLAAEAERTVREVPPARRQRTAAG